MLPLGIINEERTTIALLLEDGSYLTFNNVKNTNRSPAPSQCPAGFVPVPGNYLYGTDGFCVAKYEMKVDQNGDGLGDANTACQYSSYGTWDNAKATCGYTLSGRTIVSSASGYPLVDINQTDSKLACESIGGHLITNEEWMTLARNIEIVPSNWSSGTVGQGSLKRGNAGDVVENVSYDGVDTENGTDRNSLAMLKLTNGSEVWDLSGNVNEWSDKIYNDTDYNIPFFDLEDNLYVYPEYSVFYENGQEVNFDEIQYFVTYRDIGLNYKDLFLLNSDYNRDNGIGYMEYEYDGGYDIAFLRGGGWDDGTDAGVLNLSADDTPSDASSDLGCRCVVVPE